MAATRNVCALVDVRVRPDSREVVQKLRCVKTARNICNNLSFSRLKQERMIIFGNQLWAVEDKLRVVAFDVMTGERQHEIPFRSGVGMGCTLFRDKIYCYTNLELFEIKDGGNNTKVLDRVARCPHDIFALFIQRIDDSEITFVVELQRGVIMTATGNGAGYARCRVLKGDGHFLVGVYGSHVFIYCLESNDIVDFKNDVIERRFPADDDEGLCRFQMAPDGDLFYCTWVDSEGPWMMEHLDALTGNRTRWHARSNHVFFIPSAHFVPFYEA